MSTNLTTSTSWYRGSGTNTGYPGQIGYNGGALTARVKFHTPATGATSLHWENWSFIPQEGTNTGFRYLITEESSGYAGHVGEDGTATNAGPDGIFGDAQVQLKPDTDYYLWIWPRTSTLFRALVQGFRVEVDGVYGLPSTVEAADGSFGGSIGITLQASGQGALHTVSVSCAGRTETMMTDSSAVSCVWEPDLETYAALLPNAGSAQATITCTTKYGSTTVGTSQKTITVSFPEGSIAPTVSNGWASAAPYNAGSAEAGITRYVQGYSMAEIRFDSSKIQCKSGASIQSYRIRCGSVTVSESPYRTQTLTGDAEVICTVVDSRGQETSETLQVTVEPYFQPALTEIAVFRCDSTGAAADDGQYYSAKGKALYAQLGGENSISLSVASKQASAENYGAENALQNNTAAVFGGLSADSSYNIRLTATDGLGNTAMATVTIATQVWAMKFRPDGLGVGFGKAPEHSKCIELPADWCIRIGDRIINGT